MTKKDAKELLLKYQAGTATKEEKAFVDSWMLTGVNGDLDLNESELLNDLMEVRDRLAIDQPAKTKTIRLWPRIAAAASILFVLSIGCYFLLHKKEPTPQVAQIHDVGPAVNRAILTLANGKKIVVSNAGSGLLAQQGNSDVKKTKSGEVVYAASKSNTQIPESEIQYNSITIPRGGEYQEIALSDGTKVWINSASSLRYPTAFTGNDRKVELTGEAYFEVAHNAARPFRVTSKGQTVEVLGTHFDINAYSDEPAVKTTLLEGMVKVTAAANDEVRFLQPGRQSALSTGSFTVTPVETEEAVAWKNGLFMFNNDDIQYIMRSISRWYDVDIEYSGAIPVDTFGGGTSRFKNVSELLNILQLTGKVHFKIEGRKIVVSK